MVQLIITNLGEFKLELRKKIAALFALALERNIRSIARTDAFDTGAFMNSIHAVKEAIERGEVIVEDGVDYGKHLEWGTMKMRPRAIFQRGLNMTIKELPQILARLK